MVPKGSGDTHTQRPPDVEDVCIATNTGGVVGVRQVQEDLQLARKKLAAKKKDVDMVISIYNTETLQKLIFFHCMLFISQSSLEEYGTVIVVRILINLLVMGRIWAVAMWQIPLAMLNVRSPPIA